MIHVDQDRSRNSWCYKGDLTRKTVWKLVTLLGFGQSNFVSITKQSNERDRIMNNYAKAKHYWYVSLSLQLSFDAANLLEVARLLLGWNVGLAEEVEQTTMPKRCEKLFNNFFCFTVTKSYPFQFFILALRTSNHLLQYVRICEIYLVIM